ncbi:MAG: hypothetical protein Q8933_14930 [Bacteroidota bacterium]|nr:hypothetical protein [Bacteroidota bacterium]MDP4194866.1 hypothetical protein [Bacteroidota bacterium]
MFLFNQIQISPTVKRINLLGTTLYLILMILFSSVLILSQTQRSDSTHEYENAGNNYISAESVKENLAAIYKKIIDLKRTSDWENDFAVMMIEYNSAIRSFIGNEAEHGKDSRMVKLARQTLNRYDQVEELLKTYLGKVKKVRHKVKNEEDDATGSLGPRMPEELNKIIDETKNSTLKGEQDYDFASLLYYHCSGAVSIIEDYLNNGEDETLHKIAQRMKEDNKLSLEIIEKWKKKHK